MIWAKIGLRASGAGGQILLPCGGRPILSKLWSSGQFAMRKDLLT